MSKSFALGDRLIGEGQPAFVIAEAGANHNGDLKIAKDLVRAAREIGCDSIKFQTFSAEEFCADKSKTFTYRSQGREVTESEYEMFKRFELTRDEWAELMRFCDEEGIFFFTTVQDPVNLEMMLALGLKAIKVGSDDFDHLVNLRQYAATGLPLVVSKGMADLGEVDRVLRALRPLTDKLAVLHCVSLYPTDAARLNIAQVPTLAGLYPDIVWGFSDHSQGPLASTLAVSLGAKVIEKHFTLDHGMAGPDHWFSMDVDEMARMVKDIRFAEAALGSGAVALSPGEENSRKIMRRRIVAKADLAPGTRLDENTVTFKRADDGAFLNHWDLLKGQALRVSKNRDQGIGLGDVAFDA